MSKEDNPADSGRLSDLFEKYKPEQYYKRNYDDSKRFKSFIKVIVTAICAIVFVVLLLK